MTVISRPNSWVTVDGDPATQLTYAPRVDPAPLTVSVPGRDATLGSLVVVITNGTVDDLDVASVTFTVVVGTPGKEGSPLMPTTKGVNVEVSDTTTWSFNGPAAPVTSGTADFVLAPVSGSTAKLAAGASVYVEIYGFETMQTPGTSTVTVAEAIGTSDPEFTSFSISTFPAGFFFDSLIPTVQVASALVPVAQVTNGSTVTLTWNSSLSDIKNQTVYYSSATAGQQKATPSVLGEWNSPPLTSDTVFAVAVVAQGVGGEPLTAALVTEVSVQNPALVASSLTAGQVTSTGAASVGGLLTANGVVATGLTVNGAVVANGVTVNGALSAGSATFSGALSAGATTVNGPLSAASANVSGNVQAGSVAAGSATFTSSLLARQSKVSMITGAQTINAGNYVAYTDGFVLGTVGWPSSTGPGCVGYATGSSGGMTVVATGGNLGAFGPWWTEYQASNGNTFVLPVAAGNGYSLNARQCGGGLQQADAPIWFYWVPLGTPPSGGPTTERVGDPEELPALPEPRIAERTGAEETVALLEPFLAKPLDEETKEQLVDALRRA
jgi:hypothetical protein